MEEYPWRLKIKSYMAQIENTDTSAHALRNLSHLLSEDDSESQLTEFGEDFMQAKQYFLTGPYEELLYRLLELVSSPEYLAKHSKSISQFFIQGVPDISLEVLCAGLSETYGLLTNEKCASYLGQLITTNQLTAIVNKRCSTDLQAFNGEYDSLVQTMASLPDRVANRLGRNVPETLTRDRYYPKLYAALLSGLHHVKARLERSLPSSLAFVSSLIGKLCMYGLGMELWKILLSNIMVSQDFLISRVFHKVIVGIPMKALDATLVPLLRCVNHHEDLSALLGNTILDTRRLEHLLTEKMLLQKYFTGADCARMLYNIIGYVVSSPTRVHFYHSLFSKLLAVWSDSSSIRCISYDQHLYISKAIIVCSSFTSTATQLPKGELFKVLMGGLQNYLSSSDTSIRHIGMAVAEIVSERLNPALEAKLTFTYDSRDIFDQLLTLTSPPTVPGVFAYQSDNMPDVSVGDQNTADKETAAHQAALDLDSDDDLEPLGVFDDKPRPKESAPAYVGDCMQGLMDEQNPERVEICLKSACKLIRRSTTMTQEVSVEFAKILLSMEGSLAIDNYMQCRHDSMVSLLVVSPTSVADYLCREFASRSYNVRQRLDILEALSSAAMELSDPNADQEKTTQHLTSNLESMHLSNVPKAPDWRQIVDERVKAKTRRFASATVPAKEGSANRFAPVAGHFFFPLMSVVRDCSEYNPLKAEAMLLVQYIYTLGRITGYAQHCPLAPRMAMELMDLVWLFRYSGEVAVRKAAIFCIAMVVMVTPASDMLSQGYHVTDTIEYLQQLAERDSHEEIQEMAVKVLSYLQHHLQQG